MSQSGINKVIILGRLGQDPEVRYTNSGDPIANISIATSESWKDKQGQQHEKTEWHRVVIFGKTAEVAGEYLRKGSEVYIEGQLQTRKWQDQNGNDRYTTEIAVKPYGGVMQMIGGRNQQAPQEQAQQAQQPPQSAPPQSNGYQQAKTQPNGGNPFSYDQDIDVPF